MSIKSGMGLLNVDLYNSLKRVFGSVRVANCGVPFSASFVTDPLSGKKRLHISQRGEAYLVNCPLCQKKVGRPDTKFRLWINHRWNTKFGDVILKHLVKCYNEDCFSDSTNIEILSSKLFYGKPIESVTYDRRELKESLKEPALPENIVPLSKLPLNHPANDYLLSRKFNPIYLSERYGISYCYMPDLIYHKAFDRIVIPIYQDNKLRGWQARFIGNPPAGIPKYYNSPGIIFSNLLYGLQYLEAFVPFIILVEGVMDVWRIGAPAVASFGTHLSNNQLQEILKRTKKLIILWDGDAQEKAEKLKNQIKNKLEVSYIKLQNNLDPADLTSEEIAKEIMQYCPSVLST